MVFEEEPTFKFQIWCYFFVLLFIFFYGCIAIIIIYCICCGVVVVWYFCVVVLLFCKKKNDQPNCAKRRTNITPFHQNNFLYLRLLIISSGSIPHVKVDISTRFRYTLSATSVEFGSGGTAKMANYLKSDTEPYP